jgi:hypothetical protein
MAGSYIDEEELSEFDWNMFVAAKHNDVAPVESEWLIQNIVPKPIRNSVALVEISSFGCMVLLS